MPGYMSWKNLYKEEFYAMTEEGYDTSAALRAAEGKTPLPFPGIGQEGGGDSSVDWEQAYEQLWAIREQGLCKGYPYIEPVSWEDIQQEMSELPPQPALTEPVYCERLSGAVHGRIAGVILGKPLENGMSREDIRQYLESIGEYPLNGYVSGYSPKLDIRLREDCVPSTKGNVRYAQTDDDINYTLLAMRLVEKYGLDFTPYQVGLNLLDNIPYHWLWCSSRQAFYRMVTLIHEEPIDKQVASFPWKLNPWRECIDGQIKTDLYGYICPGDPLTAAKLAYRDCSFSLAKNGSYGGMFVAACVAAAMTENPTVDRIIDSGLAVIPKKSRLHEAISWVRERYAALGDPEAVCKEIEERFKDMPFSGTMNNLSMTALALLCGKLDYSATITHAVMFGIDTDCNGGTAGSICGAAVGRSGIEDRWIEPLNDTVHTCVADIGRIGIAEMTDRIAKLRVR